ncbi:DUF4394 domain-containing protein [Streptomyces sp. TRM66268-LWL]|uniref:DUF4394 domain-containing protein n=1 Tax=Streptomyces polyasparticus TaxID=2767826 RepID=A0ABR7SMU2_9ACTN|nr:DUF4394 domain-containing protein [Streptomyces polyasparticus]MBC9716169.1 DUF4394 domain-containing protein [Streptomyces polyasparticus]
MRKQTIIGIVTMGLALGTVGAVGAGALGGTAASADRAAVGTRSAAGAFGSSGPRAVGLTFDQRLVAFRTDQPGKAVVLGKVDGLQGDTSLIGIDYRVQDKKLYAVGDRGGVYTVREAGARAEKVSQLTVALQGQSFGVDFNPAANRLRVISDTGQNLRHNIDDAAGAPAAGTTAADGTLTNPTPPGGTALGVTGAAYTNNDLDAATGTTLFDLDTSADQIAIQSPANNGSLAPTGKLGVDAGAASGFDILSSGRSGINTGYAVTRNSVFRVDLLTGKASSLGSLPEGRQVVDLALPLNQ